jgi:hypothetical protein
LDASQTMVSRWLRVAGQQAGLDLSLGEDGHCRLQLEDGSQCIVEAPQDSELVFIYLPVAKLPDDPSLAARAMRSALSLNMFGLATGGSAYSYDDRTDHIVLTFSARLDMLDETLFAKVLGDFLDVAIAAKARMQVLLQSHDAGTVAVPPSPHMICTARP